DVPKYIQTTGLSSQAAAREKRYEFLFEMAKRHDAHGIALAHHADDQAETVLMRLLHGSGSGGLSGIQIRRDAHGVSIIRPLLKCYKEELLHYCHVKNISYSLDSSNEERHYMRNQVRL